MGAVWPLFAFVSSEPSSHELVVTNIITKATLSKAQNLSMCLLAFFILVDVECLGTESGSEQEMQPDLHIIKDLELLLLSAANGERFQIPEALSPHMEGDVDQACLKIQLLMIPNMIKYQESNNNENTHRCSE